MYLTGNIRAYIQNNKFLLFEILIIFLLGLVPLLWYRTGYIISNSDSFPIFLNFDKTLRSDALLWSDNTLGTVELMPAFLIYQYFMGYLNSIGLTIGAVQIIFQVIFLMGPGFSMFYFVKVLYSKSGLAPLIASIFYMFNFFVLQSRLNVGLVWIYAFIPLLMAFLLSAIRAACEGKSKESNKLIICFSIVLMIACSFASINPTNIALLLIALLAITVFGTFKYRDNLKTIFRCFFKIILLAIPLNIWWILPFLNVYIFSPQLLNSQINVVSWAWTQSRSSFLNLFWFNGIWGWLPEYVPYYTAYNGFLLVLVFVPFIIGVAALFFRSKNSITNVFLMLWILLFIFLAKGMHSPLESVNAFLYEHIPLMNMFREPTSKFTMLIVLFIAPLIGYATARFTNLIGRYNRIMKHALPIILVIILMVSTFPMLINSVNPLETKTDAPNTFNMPSSYVQIPNYWLDAATWINNQSADGKVLFTPLDDFYQMPYIWGYYGVDQIFYRLMEKSVVSTDYLYSYVLKSETVTALKQLQSTVANNQTSDFRVFLDLLNIRYILQRNDINSSMVGRNIKSPEYMNSFFAEQPYLRLVASFGNLEIYEYSDAKPSIYIYSQSTLSKSSAVIETAPVTAAYWGFQSPQEVKIWSESNSDNQEIQKISFNNGSIKISFNTNSLDWENITSPMISTTEGITYHISANVSGGGESKFVYLIVREFFANGSYIYGPYSGSYPGKSALAELDFSPFSGIESVQIQVGANWPNSTGKLSNICINDVNVTYTRQIFKHENIDFLFDPPLDNQTVSIISYQNLNPTVTTLKVNVTTPFVIATSLALDKNWVAIVNGERIKPTTLYLGLDGFKINQTGILDITLEYEPQVWFSYCSVISISTIIICLVLLFTIGKECKFYLTVVNWSKRRIA